MWEEAEHLASWGPAVEPRKEGEGCHLVEKLTVTISIFKSNH